MAKLLRRAFGETVRRLRIEAGLSQEEFADRARVSRNFQGSVERGESGLSLDVAERFAEALSLTLVDLLLQTEQSRSASDTNSRRRIAKRKNVGR